MRTRLLLALLLCFSGSLGWGQSQSITLSGIITDPSAASVAQVKIVLANVETGETWSATSNDTGTYTIPLVKPGRYSLTAEVPGFKQYYQTGIVLETGVPARADVRLEVGPVAESVTVEADVPLLVSETSAVGAVVDNQTIANTPLINRRASQLAQITGFVVQVPSFNPVGGSAAFAVAGGRGNDMAWLIDGGAAQMATLGVAFLVIDPPIE